MCFDTDSHLGDFTPEDGGPLGDTPIHDELEGNELLGRRQLILVHGVLFAHLHGHLSHLRIHDNIAASGWLNFILGNDDVITLLAGSVAVVIEHDGWESSTISHSFEKIMTVFCVFSHGESLLDLFADVDETAGNSAAHIDCFEDFLFKLGIELASQGVSEVKFSKLSFNRDCWIHFSGVSTAHFC